ncbi:hypothetical protein F5B22DRAFT_649951 [Xylaria bambusicola]|uniref:uncharacterized protein n=1 Tax=Xylaria bambusicola TaxID=326684 RepID=UPI002008B70B|nr:uncharacterized protein F5B22DRAFT_649951 [Xylaria bambusicola]KAI0508458.1 hypothetical protein F5B22DRAFT_649951 [Xylaria bambusicola]
MIDQLPTAKSSLDNESSLPSLSDNSTVYSSEPHREFPSQLGGDRTTVGFLRRRFPSVRPQKRQETDQGGLKGPFGLQLLHASPQPLIDIVFVHGLRGGSFKTWRKGDDSQLFWPQYWLPMETDLRNASIHSFGYDSDRGSLNPGVLNAHDFGRTLYGELGSSPYLGRNSNSPIIMVGHSMGELVIKKVCFFRPQGIQLQTNQQQGIYISPRRPYPSLTF